MKKGKESKLKPVLLTIAAVIFVGFVLLPLTLSVFDGEKVGNVALIPVEGLITTDGASTLGQTTASSTIIIQFIEEADKNKQVKVILLEINVHGGTPVATDEIAEAIKKTKKPTIALIKDVAASAGYWIASSADHIIANRMSLTGSIGVLSSYLEFSGLMEEYGVGYERLIAGEYKDMGAPFRKLTEEERLLIQGRLDRLHQFFIQEVADNRNLPLEKVKEIATGEVFLGVDALPLGLVDQLGNQDTAEQFIKEKYQLAKVDYITYRKEVGFWEMLAGFTSQFSFRIGEGIGSRLLQKENNLLLI